MLQKLEMDGKKFDKILRISKQYIEIHKQRVQKTEEYLAKYGYQKPGDITGLLLPCVIFPLLHLQMVLPCLEFAQT